MMRFFVIMMLLAGCVQFFDPSIEQPEDQPIIIDALLTDELKNHQVRISSAKYIDASGQFATIENAEVFLEDSEGTVYLYNHMQNGVYLSEDTFAGKKDLRYRLAINIDSEQYLSDFESIPDPGDIINIKSEFGYKLSQPEPGVFSERPQVEFFVDIVQNSEENAYFRFDWEATYRAETLNQGDTICWYERKMEPPSDLKSESCYVTEYSSNFIRIFSTEGLNTGEILNDISVYSIHPNKRFQFRYSPEITIYSISKSTYEFWEQIINQNENAGGLFDPPLGPINGNIKSINGSSRRIIGIFEVASVTKKRSFFPASVATIELRNYIPDCIFPDTDPSGKPQVYPRPFFCCDCTYLPNSTNVKPDFW